MEEMWNEAFKDHKQQYPLCQGNLQCDLDNEQKRGFSSRMNLICTSCNYKSRTFNLYEELETKKPGRKPSKINTGIHVGLSQTPIASTSLRKIILSGNMQVPAASSLQNTANKVMKRIKQVNTKDMQRRREEIVEINRLRGKDNPESVSLQMDGMYNNPLYSGVGRTPFQPATQTVYTAAENITTDHQILGINVKNKLCSCHSSLDVDPDSGQLHAECSEDCSANIPMVKSIGDEYKWAKELLRDLKEDSIEVEHIVTDPDSSAYRAAQDLYEEGETQTEPEHFLDTRHVSENMRKGLKKDDTLLKAMPASTKVKRQKLLNTFSTDLTERCNAELAQATKKSDGDFSILKRKISYVVDAIIECYCGNHALCKKYSFVCGGKKNLWTKRGSLLPKSFKIVTSESNKECLRKSVSKRLGPKILEKTRLNMNTNFVEGFNRSLRRSLPSNVTFKKNVSGRAHSAVHSVNYGPGESILELCSALHCEIPVGSSAYGALKSIQKYDFLQKQHKQSLEYKKFRSDKRAKLYKLYEKLGEMIDYEKNTLLKTEKESEIPKRKHSEHSYSKIDQKRRKSVRK